MKPPVRWSPFPRRASLAALVVGLLGVGPVPASAHFPFSYADAQISGVVQAALPPGSVGTINPGLVDFTPQPKIDYLRLQPLVTGYTWLFRGTISDTRTTLPAELRIEVLAANRQGAGANLTVAYTVRHSLTLGSTGAVTTVSGIVNEIDDRVLSSRTVPTDARLPIVEHTFLEGGLRNAPRRIETKIPGGLNFEYTYYALATETTAEGLSDGLAASMRFSCSEIFTASQALGTFEVVGLTQKLAFGSLAHGAALFNAAGDITGLTGFAERPPAITVNTTYAAEVGPISIHWQQTESNREPVTGNLSLVETNFPIVPQSILFAEITTQPRPAALEPGSPLSLTSEVVGIKPNSNLFSNPSTDPIIDAASTEYRWTTPLGDRWTPGPGFYLNQVGLTDAGTYRLSVISPSGTAQSDAVRVSVIPPAPASRLVNVASRALTGAGADTIIAGVVLRSSGSGGGDPRPILIRAIGPALRDFGLTSVEPDPVLVVYDADQREIARSDDWNTSPETAQRIITATQRVGTFPLPVGSRDAALVLDLPPGAYTAHLLSRSPAATRTIGLIEVYDANPAEAAGPQIINLSTRSRIGAGDEILIPGIVVTKDNARLFVRALGPALSASGITDYLPDPEITLYRGDTPVAYNDNWILTAADLEPTSVDAPTLGQPSATQAAKLVGAQNIRFSSKDAALVATLPPGNYTLHVRSRDPRQTGIAVAEVYLMNP